MIRIVAIMILEALAVTALVLTILVCLRAVFSVGTTLFPRRQNRRAQGK